MSGGHAETPARRPSPRSIDRNGVLILIRSSLLALDQANKTGNYTVLRDIGAPGFQVPTAQRGSSEIFAKLRNDNLDLCGVAVIDPQLNLLPQIEANGLMHMAGFFPSVPDPGQFRSGISRRSTGSGGCSAFRCRSDRAGRLRRHRPKPPVAQRQPAPNGAKQPHEGAKAPAAAKSAPATKLTPPDNSRRNSSHSERPKMLPTKP